MNVKTIRIPTENHPDEVAIVTEMGEIRLIIERSGYGPMGMRVLIDPETKGNYFIDSAAYSPRQASLTLISKQVPPGFQRGSTHASLHD
jgi:hypothetical protein